jgi:hypothetical protein
VTGDVDEPECFVGRLRDAVNSLETICSKACRRENAILPLVQLADLKVVAEPEVILAVAEDAPDNVIA